jgi:hypothetical protein
MRYPVNETVAALSLASLAIAASVMGAMGRTGYEGKKVWKGGFIEDDTQNLTEFEDIANYEKVSNIISVEEMQKRERWDDNKEITLNYVIFTEGNPGIKLEEEHKVGYLKTLGVCIIRSDSPNVGENIRDDEEEASTNVDHLNEYYKNNTLNNTLNNRHPYISDVKNNLAKILVSLSFKRENGEKIFTYPIYKSSIDLPEILKKYNTGYELIHLLISATFDKLLLMKKLKQSHLLIEPKKFIFDSDFTNISCFLRSDFNSFDFNPRYMSPPFYKKEVYVRDHGSKFLYDLHKPYLNLLIKKDDDTLEKLDGMESVLQSYKAIEDTFISKNDNILSNLELVQFYTRCDLFSLGVIILEILCKRKKVSGINFILKKKDKPIYDFAMKLMLYNNDINKEYYKDYKKDDNKDDYEIYYEDYTVLDEAYAEFEKKIKYI